jgi:hypothetical protein
MTILPQWFRRRDGGRVATLEEAIKILGKDKICTAQEVYRARGEQFSGTCELAFLVKTLKFCASQNKKKLADWRLVYAIGLNFKRQYTDEVTKDHIFRQPFLQREVAQPWFNTSSPSGYWLVNFKPHFPNKTFDIQIEDLTNLGAQYQPLPEHVFSEILFSFVQAKGERLFEDKYHQGPSRVRLGRFRDGSLIIEPTDLPDSTRKIVRKDTGICYFFDPGMQPQASHTS